MTQHVDPDLLLALGRNYLKKKQLKEELEELAAEDEELQEQLIEQFVDADVKPGRIKIKVVDPDTGEEVVRQLTPYLHRQLWASLGTGGKELASILKEEGLEEFTTVHSGSLSSYVRECVGKNEDRAMPQEVGREVEIACPDTKKLSERLRKQLKLTEKFSVRFRKA